MNPEKNQKIRNRILEAATKLKGQLPPHPAHPNGRNPFAHIPKVIIDLMGESYKTLDDDKYDEVMAIIDFCEENPF